MRHRRYGLHDDPVPVPPIFDEPIDLGPPVTPPIINLPNPGEPPQPWQYPIGPTTPPPVSAGGAPKPPATPGGISPLLLLGGGLLLFFFMKGKR